MVMLSSDATTGNARCESERRRRARNSRTNRRLHALMGLLERVKVMADDLSEEVAGDELAGYMPAAERLGLQEDLMVLGWNVNMGLGCISCITLNPDKK
jgi:hypothetical protein